MSYVRCSQGHVFERTSSAVCPVCGEGAVVGSPGEQDPPEPIVPASAPWHAKSLPLAAGALAVVVIGVWLVVSSTSPSKTKSEPEAEKSAHTQTEDGNSQGASEGQPPQTESGAKPEASSENKQSEPPKQPDQGGQPPGTKEAATTKAAPSGEEDLSQHAKGTKDPGLAKPNDHAELPAVEFPSPSVKKIQASLKVSDLIVDLEMLSTLSAEMQKQTTPRHVALLLKLSERGVSSATYLAAVAFINGRGIPKDDARGLKLLEEAAAAGHPVACLILGSLLFYGESVPKDLERAKELTLRAARTPLPGAVKNLGMMGVAQKEVGPTADDAMALANANNVEAVRISRDLLAKRVVAGAVPLFTYSIQFSKDMALRREAVGALPDAARAGLPLALSSLAGAYGAGEVLVQNTDETLMWAELFRKSCGEAFACTTLDKMSQTLRQHANIKEIKRLRDAIRDEADPPDIDMQ